MYKWINKWMNNPSPPKTGQNFELSKGRNATEINKSLTFSLPSKARLDSGWVRMRASSPQVEEFKRRCPNVLVVAWVINETMHSRCGQGPCANAWCERRHAGARENKHLICVLCECRDVRCWNGCFSLSFSRSIYFLLFIFVFLLFFYGGWPFFSC